MTVDGPSMEVRLMALEIVVAEQIAAVCRTAGDPYLALQIKRQKYTWFFEEKRGAIADSLQHRFYPEELQIAVDQLLLVARKILERGGLA